MRSVAEIEEFVVRFEGRGPGTDAERRAAGYLSGCLRALGRVADTEPIWVWPNHSLAHLSHAVLAILGSIVATANADVGLALIAVAVVSAFGDLSGRLYLLRRLTGRRASQTVVSREDRGRAGTLVLVAHYDSARGGAVFEHSGRRRAVLSRLIRRPIGPFDAASLSLLLLLIAIALRALGVTGVGVSILQFVPTVVLILSVPLLADLAVSDFVPGADDNASGVATVLRLADRYGGNLEHFDLWVLFPGASEGMLLGTRAWLRRHRRELDPRRTVFVNLDDVAQGTVRYTTREGVLLTRRFHSQLLALCAQIAEEDAGEDRYGVRPLTSREASDAHPAAVAGFPAVSISCAGPLGRAQGQRPASDAPERVDEVALERALGFCSELIELIDERIGPELAQDTPAAQAPAR